LEDFNQCEIEIIPLQARKKAIKILKQIIADRKASGKTHNDMLAELVGNEKTRYHLNEEQIFDQVFTILYSGYETVSITTMMAIKYLHDNPKALQKLRVRVLLIIYVSYFCCHHDNVHNSFLDELNQEEHFTIRERKKPDEPIDWNDYKSMSFTRAVSKIEISNNVTCFFFIQLRYITRYISYALGTGDP
jgi:brassinosteroid-6-oxidase 1